MSFGKTIPLYCITFLVLWLGGRATLTESLEVIRGYHDKFLNSQCSTSGSATSDDGSVCSEYSHYCTNSKEGKCADRSDCTYCICNVDGRNTFIGNGPGSGKCVKDEDVEPESVPENSFRFQSNNHRGRCAKQENDSSVRGHNCNDPSHRHRMLWIWTTWKQFMNIETLECIEVPTWGKDTVAMKQCNTRSRKQNFSCSVGLHLNQNIYLTKDNTRYLRMTGSGGNYVIEVKKNSRQVWANGDGSSTLLCDTPTKYKGCYRFWDGSFLRFLSIDECQDDSCLTKRIAAPIFTYNTNCKLNWQKSEYIHNENSWESAKDYKNYFSVVKTPGVKGRELKILDRDALRVWNGSLLKLQISCSNTLGDARRPSEEHCVLLKFATLSDPQVIKSTTLVPPVTTHKPFILPTITINPTSSERGISQMSKPELRSPILPGSKSEFNGGSSPSKAVAISVSIVALILILLLVFGFMVFYRRRKRMQEQRANSEEMISHGEQNPQKVIYEEPSQMYEPLKDERGETSGEHFYEGLKATNPPEERPLGATNDVYTYIDGDQGTAKPASTEEYSYARSDAMPRSFGTQLPTPAPPAGTPVYQTLEGPKSEDNPSWSQNGMPNKAPSVANNPPGQQSPNPESFYEGLKATNPPEESPLGTTNDVYTYIDEDQGTVKPASTEEEYSYARSDAMPRSFGTQLPMPAPPAGTPVYQTLEGPETEDNPSSRQNGMPNKAPSVATNPLDQQPANPVYQTLEEPNAQKSDPTQVEYITIAEAETGQNSSETLGKSSADTSADEPVYHELDNA